MANCRICGAEIKWVKTFSGKSMPVDVEEKYFFVGDGKDLFVTDNGAVIRGTTVSGSHQFARQMGAMRGYISHFVTCPNADFYRKRR